MVERVGNDEVGGPGERGDDPEIGLVARREEQGTRSADKGGQSGLQPAVGGEVAGDQTGGRGPKSLGRGGRGCGGGQGGVAGQAEVVVGREGQQGGGARIRRGRADAGAAR